MVWAIFLHLYQPPNQRPEILQKIVDESYRPLINGFLKNPKARLTININACLTELLALNGAQDVIDGLRRLAENKQLELTGSGKYHPFLPVLPKSEIERQIRLNNETNRKYFGPIWQPKGFFPPEMGYDRKVAEVVSSLGFDWIILDEIAGKEKIETEDFRKIYKINKLPLKVLFRERRASNLIMGAQVWTIDSTYEALKPELSKERYLLTAMDGETFGHHRPGLENLLFGLFAADKFRFVTVSEAIQMFKGQEDQQFDPIPCSWASSQEEIDKNEPFYLYYREKNRIHVLLKQLLDLAIKVAGGATGEERMMLDRAESCNSFWWANPDAWWSIEEIEIGAFNLKNVVDKAQLATFHDKEEATHLYQDIMAQAFAWQREGLVHQLHAEKQAWIKIPFKKRAKPGEYEAIIEILKKEMAIAVSRQEFEQAIRWRDSIYKLEHGLDIYNLVHVVDQLRAEGRLGEYAKLTEEYKKKYQKLTPGQPE